MSRQVILTRTAQRRLENLLEYIEQSWSSEIKLKFIGKLESRLDLIKAHPNLFPVSEKKQGLHKCVITKHNSLYYTYDDHSVYVLTIFDTRQDPDLLLLEITK